MSQIEAASLAASIMDLAHTAAPAVLTEALQIIVSSRRLPGQLLTRAHVTQALREELGRQDDQITGDLVQQIWDRLPEAPFFLNESNNEQVKEVACAVILEMSSR